MSEYPSYVYEEQMSKVYDALQRLERKQRAVATSEHAGGGVVVGSHSALEDIRRWMDRKYLGLETSSSFHERVQNLQNRR